VTDTTTIRYGTCPLCEASCGLRYEVVGEAVVDLRGDPDDPLSRGHLCPKAAALPDLHRDPDRLTTPLRRTAGSGFAAISWKEAIAEAADRIHRIQDQHGRDAMAVYVGNPAVHATGTLLYGPPLLRSLGTKNRYSATSVDQLPHMLVAHLMFGHQLLLPVPDLDRTKTLLMLGANPLASNGSLMTAPGIGKRLRGIQARGGRVLVIDPRRTETARAADVHVFIHPGTDALFLLALLREVLALRDGRPRLHHLAGRVEGLDPLGEALQPFSPERVAGPTGVPGETIQSLARELVDGAPAVVYGRVGTSTQAFGSLCQWAINLVNLVNGALDREGGAMFPTPAIDLVSGPARIGRGAFGRWRSRVRGLPEFAGELPVATLGDEILTPGPGQVRGLLTVAGNPVLSTPNGARLDEALGTLDTYIAVDPYLNETTRHAHLILPPVSPLSRLHYDLVFHHLAVRNTAKFSPPLFPPGPDDKDDGRILGELRLALERRRSGPLGRRALEARTMLAAGPERLLDLGLRLGPRGAGVRPGRRGLTLERLRREPHGVDLGPLVPCLADRLGDRRIAAMPAPLVAELQRLAHRYPEGDSLRAAPRAIAADRRGDTLTLIGRRELRSNNSWMHNVPRLMRGRDRCTLLIHPRDAARREIRPGARVAVRSRVGEVTVPAELSDDVMPGVVCLPHGFGHGRRGVRLRVAQERAGASLNDLTDPELLDGLSGNAALSGVPVTVAPASD
jgi:anaerobic selenocysteine-containing dehydrogenase